MKKLNYDFRILNKRRNNLAAVRYSAFNIQNSKFAKGGTSNV